jgi:cyclopropane-fatty-acyl-phospholipid synthase
MIAEKIKSLFEDAGIRINGPNFWDVHVHDERFFERVARDKSLGLGESYMDGWWDCEGIDQMIFRLLSSNAQNRAGKSLSARFFSFFCILRNMQSSRRARMIADQHYDLGNDLFSAFLDPYYQYSCAFFDDTDDLEQAQLNKLDMVCRKLQLSSDDHLLDIGSGWGGLARYAAEHYGCRVTGVNISREQLKFSREFCKDLPVEFIDKDYRRIEGSFSKIVSVGMFEHVGCKNYPAFFQTVHRCLEENGIFLLHTIGGNASRPGGNDAWTEKYIFPNGMVPSIAQVGSATEDLFVLEDLHNIGPHYDKTLMAWNANFQIAWPELSAHYDQRFKRMWEYFLLSFAGGFRARAVQVWQMVMTRACDAAPQPICRFGSQAESETVYSER